jgi:hypothetical protein
LSLGVRVLRWLTRGANGGRHGAAGWVGFFEVARSGGIGEFLHELLTSRCWRLSLTAGDEITIRVIFSE